MLPASLLGFVFFNLFTRAVQARPAPGLWEVHIFKGPAPSPEEGPPASANALRDPKYLKYEIIGIVGAYLLWTLVTLILIFTVGKRLRRRAQSSNRTLSMQMMNKVKTDVAPGPLSPGKLASLKSWVGGGKGHSHKESSVSVSTIDEKTVEMDRQRNMDEMTRLYAAVMAHDEEQSQKARSSEHVSPRSPKSPFGNRHQIDVGAAYAPSATSPYLSPPMSPEYPPEFEHLRQAAAAADEQGTGLSHPLAPTPVDDTFTRRPSTLKTPRTFSSQHSRSGSSNSAKTRPGHISVRGLPISNPIASANLEDSLPAGHRSPLSPRLYNPGPAPPTPAKDYQPIGMATSPTIEQTMFSRQDPPASLNAKMASASSTAINTSRANGLPFRQYYQDALRSAPATKTTFVDATHNMGVHPKTGVPQTPYSPYTPFTPMTPITPSRLVGKQERKRNKKKEGLKVLSEDDMVMSDEDMWGAV